MGSCMATILLISRSHGSTAHVTGVLQLGDTSSLGRTIWEEKEMEFPLCDRAAEILELLLGKGLQSRSKCLTNLITFCNEVTA